MGNANGLTRTVPSPFDSGEDASGVTGPHKGLGVGVGLGEEAVDGGLKIGDRVEDAAVEAPPREVGGEALNGIEPGRRKRIVTTAYRDLRKFA